MNYEELLASKNDGRLYKTQLPIGEYYRQQVDGKYRGVVDVRPELNQSVVFSEALKEECSVNVTLKNTHQLHFEPMATEGDVERLEVEQGVYMSFEQLLHDSPAIVARKDFADQVMQALVDVASYLHTKGIQHVCFSPSSVLCRKGDNHLMVLSHGSFYLAMNNQEELYGDDVRYVAPEVLEHGTVDGRADVYSIGQFMTALFEHSVMPIEYKQAIKKAVSPKAENRFATPEEMLKTVRQRRGTLRSLTMLAVAIVVGALSLWIYFDSMPETQQIEFVKPAPRQATDDLVEDGYMPEDLGVTNADTLNGEDYQTMREYKAKAEEIFRKNYTKEADRILSKIYSKEYMSNSEKTFLSQSKSTIEELMERQAEMGEAAGLTPERSQLIASEIIERITNEKKKELGGTNSRAVQK